MHVEKFSLGPLGTNCYIVVKGNDCLIFDPSGEAEKISAYIKEQDLKPKAILLTHAHFDHIGALDDIRQKYNLPVYLHKNEEEWLEDPTLNRSEIYFGKQDAIQTKRPEKLLQEGILKISNFEMEVIHTPGHSPGSTTFIFRDEQFIISGDVLFHHGIGRTDLPGGSIDQLANSILSKLFQLPDEFVVYAGHNIPTTIGYEKLENPYTLAFKRG